MADDADIEAPPDPEFEEKVERLAMKLLRGGDGNEHTSMASARRAARRMLEDSEARTAEGWALEPDDDNVIRRSSSESAAIGDTGPMRVVSDGE